MGNENINLNFPQLENNLGINFKAPLLVSQIPTETEIEPVIDIENKPEQQFQIIDSFERYNIETDPNKFPWNSQNSEKIINPANTDWSQFEVAPANEEYNFTGKTLDERLNDLKSLQPLEITSETSMTDIENYKKLLEDSRKTVAEGISRYGRLGNNLSLLNANRNLLSLEADYNKQLENLAKQPDISDERKAELNELSLNSRNNSERTDLTDNTQSTSPVDANTPFKNQSDEDLYKTIVMVGFEAGQQGSYKIGEGHYATLAAFENRLEKGSRWNRKGDETAESLIMAKGQFAVAGKTVNVHDRETAIQQLTAKFGGRANAEIFVDTMFQTMKEDNNPEYQRMQQRIGNRDSWNNDGKGLVIAGNAYR